MALDPRIPLLGQTPDVIQPLLGGIAAGNRIQAMQQEREEAPLRRQMMDEQLNAARLNTLSGRQRQLTEEDQSVIRGSLAIKPFLDNQDLAGAEQALAQRRAQLESLGLNTAHTDQALELLRTNPNQLSSMIDANIDIGYKTGVLQDPQAQRGFAPTNLGKLIAERDTLPVGSPERAQYDRVIESQGRSLQGTEDPAAVREFQYYQSLSPEAKAEWDRSRRGDKASTATEKEIFSAVDGAQQASVQFENYSDLASRYEQSPNLASGAAGSVAEWLKEQTGTQDAASLLRRDWAAVKASEVVKNLPPGAASDADIKMALAGFLPNNANPRAVASFLRGTAKLAKINGEFQSFKADYLSENKSPAGLLKAWREQAKTTGSTLSSGNQEKVGRFTIEAE